VPYFDSTYALTYHWNATHQLGLDLGGKVLESDYTCGNENGVTVSSQNSSLRDDMKYTVFAGVTYAFNANLSASLSYTYDIGDNALDDLASKYAPDYREFDRQMVSLGLQYKF
jgi:opacity protein-like surface antigen